MVKLSDGFNGADMRNICTEAGNYTKKTFLTLIGMFAIRGERDYCIEEDFMKAVRKVADAKKLESTMNYEKL